ncbi:MAG: allantoinase AllB [Verrucomicrobia bacterium]|nr:allantoinase AllB [Verrucomicrobiota bacterium]
MRCLVGGSWTGSEIAIEAGRIVEIGSSVMGAAQADVDGDGAYCLPGGVDLHVHFNEPGRTEWEGFATGSAAAAAGGLTYVAEMPLNSIPSTTSVSALYAKQRAIQGKSWIDYGLWGGVVPGNADHLPALAEAGVMGFKAFMSPSGTDDFENSDRATLRRAMEVIAPTGLRLALHAEDPAVLHDTVIGLRQRECAADWEASRPIRAELEAVRTAIDLAGETGCPITIVHVSAAEVVDLIDQARAGGLDILCETCPHYLLLSLDDAEQIGPQAKCAPPLRSAHEVSALWERLRAGKIDTLGSDHSPCPPEMKTGMSFFEAWGGIAGLQHGLPGLLDATGLGEPGRIAALSSLFAERPARALGLTRKGTLHPGSDADFTLVKPLERKVPIQSGLLLSRHPCSAYVGRPLGLQIEATWLRGMPVVEDGRLCGEARGVLVKGSGDHTP